MMTRFTILASASMIALASVAQAEQLRVSSIDVTVELPVAEGANALELWPTIETDLETAVATDIADQIGDSIHDVRVNLNEISLDGAYVLEAGGAFNTMEGFVNVFRDNETVPIESFPVRLEAYSASAVNAPEGAIILPPEQEAFYDALIMAFAAETGKHLSTVDVMSNTTLPPQAGDPDSDADGGGGDGDDAPDAEAE